MPTFRLILIVSLFLCVSCGDQSSPNRVAHADRQAPVTPVAVSSADTVDTPEAATNLPVLRFCVPPWQKDKTQKAIQRQYKPMLDWLGKQVGYQFTVITATSYDQAVEFLATGKVDVANLSPVPYVLCKERNPEVQLLATCLQWSKDGSQKIDSYGGFILALKENDRINTIADLEGERFGFVKPESSSGFKYPNAMLKKDGVDYNQFFSKAYFLGSHPRVTDAIVLGSIQAGATWDFNWNQAKAKHGDVFKVIAKTERIPNLCIAVHPDVPDEVAGLMRQSLLEIDEALLEGLSMCGFVERPDSFYDVVRDVVQASR